MKTHGSYALGSAVATDGGMVIEEEPAVLDAQIVNLGQGSFVELAAGMLGALASTVAESLFHELFVAATVPSAHYCSKDLLVVSSLTVFQDTFRKMYALSSYIEALTPMPEDGGHRRYGTEDVVKGVWLRSCALFGCALWSVVQGLWFKGVGEETWLSGRPFKFEKQWAWH
ncbi:hypothetical protein Tco_1216567 [Tanacetum coccineum]